MSSSRFQPPTTISEHVSDLRKRRIQVKEHLCKGKGSLRFNRVFSLLIESGLIYCCIWVGPTSRSVNTRRRVHYTIADCILVRDGWPVARSRLHRRSVYLSEYCTGVPHSLSSTEY